MNSKIGIRDILDGTSGTILVGEVSWSKNATPPQRWYGAMNPNGGAPTGVITELNRVTSAGQVKINENDNDNNFNSLHQGGAQFLFADGVVKFLSENIEHTAVGYQVNNLFDKNNGGAGYGTYQRLFSISDSYSTGSF